ncbi:SRPBCC family protein [Kiloniella sp.]|uniref:SRPBCC family protein n=1 Tax=Kiloniella sp. TaxID=1938587 RepID=UPI003B02B0A6
MVTISVEKIVNAPVASVWASWDDYANIYKFHPGLNNSYLLESKNTTGMGALRQCDFTDGKTFLKEKVIGYEKNSRMRIEIFDTNAPIKKAQALFDFTNISSNQTRVVMTMTFTPKMGLLGKLLTPIMKKQFTKGLTALLEGNAKYVEEMAVLKSVA